MLINVGTMKKKCYLLVSLITLFFILNARLPFSHIITFFIQEAPFNGESSTNKFNEAATAPGKLASKIALSMVSHANRGIFATYGGYLVVSGFNGQITFPRMQQKEELTLIITERIEPVLMLGNTIHHWVLPPNIPVAVYSIIRKQDPTTKLYYWDVKPTKRPKNNIIPLTSIVIFAKPKDMIVPIGITLSNDNPQFLLPTIYAKKNSNELAPTLGVLKIRQFFGSVSITNKKENNTYYSTQMITTQ